MKRRQFCKSLACILLGSTALLAPLAAGIVFFLAPLRRLAPNRGFVRVTSLESLPLGVPRRFVITATRTDAWNQLPDFPIGAVYLIRQPEQLTALQVMCPHAGCSVEFNGEQQKFLCPCHRSLFELDGSLADPDSPAPRGLDRLEVKVHDSDVLVRYQEFRQGTGQRIAV